MIHFRHTPERRLALARTPGFTLVELMVVLVIVLLVSAVTLPTVIPALNSRQVGEGARIVQAALAGARDAAIRANAPRGIRLLPDPTLSTLSAEGPLAANRIVPIEPAPALTDGFLTFPTKDAIWLTGDGNAPVFPFPIDPTVAIPSPANNGIYPYPLKSTPVTNPPATRNVLMVVESFFQQNRPNLAPNPRANWFWNVRVGDRIRISESGAIYTVVGPMTVNTPERFVNDGQPGSSPLFQDTYYNPLGGSTDLRPEYLFLVNGVDDNGDGYIDQGVNGVNENLNFTSNGTPIVDDILEWLPPATPGQTQTPETEVWLSSALTGASLQASIYPQVPSPPTIPPIGAQSPPAVFSYTIYRRPVVSPGAKELTLPSAALVDLTTWSTTRERSRLPVNPYDGTVDILLSPTGEVISTTAYSTPASNRMDNAFLHFWIADRSDVMSAVFPSAAGVSQYPALPVPEGIANYPPPRDPYTNISPRYLKRDRQLVTLYARTGNVVSNTVEFFDMGDPANSIPPDPARPYRDAQLGIREAK